MTKARVTITITTGNAEMLTGEDVEQAIAATLARTSFGSIGTIGHHFFGLRRPVFDANGQVVGQLRVTRA
jgi:hypothetical protein